MPNLPVTYVKKQKQAIIEIQNLFTCDKVTKCIIKTKTE